MRVRGRARARARARARVRVRARILRWVREGSSTPRDLGGLRFVPGHCERRGRRGGMMSMGTMGVMLTPPHGRRLRVLELLLERVRVRVRVRG